MPVKEKLSGISLLSLLPKNSVKPLIIIKDEALSSSPFIISKNRKIISPFTGRIKELDYLRTLYSETIQRIKKQNSGATLNSKPIIAAIKGEPGIGKSRLVSEFIKQITKTRGNNINSVLAGKNLNTGQEPCGMFRDIIPGLNNLDGAANGDQSNITLNNTAKEFLYKKAVALNKQNTPLTLVFEDMQWADEMSLSILEHILKTINIIEDKDQPQILIVLNYRNNFKPSKVLRTESEYRELSVEGLSDADTIRLMESLWPAGTAKGNIADIIAARSDGNPFNIEEWCALFSSSKKLSKIPQTIKHLLVDKVSSLNTEERSILIIAGVLGRKFELKIVNEILKLSGKPLAAKHIMKSLEEKRYIVNLTGDVYEFRHDILQETIYLELRKDVKQNVHLLAGEAIENLYPGKISAYYYELARHYTSAKNEAKSIYYLEKAGDKAKDNYEHERALRYYRQLLKMVSGNKAFGITFKICDVHMNRSEWNKQVELCESILKTSPRLDKYIKAECFKRIGHTLRLKGEYKAALQNYKKAYHVYNKHADVYNKLDIMEKEAKVLMEIGKYVNAENNFKIVLDIAIKNHLTKLHTEALIGLGIVCTKLGKLEHSTYYNNELLEQAILSKDLILKVKAKINLGEAYFLRREYKNALILYKDALKGAQNLERTQDIAICNGNIGTINYVLNNFEISSKFFKNQILNFTKLGDLVGISRTYGSLGAVYISKGDFHQAKDFIRKQLQLSIKLNRKQSIAICYCNLGIIYNLTGDFKAAKKLFLKQLQIDKRLKNKDGVIRANINLGIQYLNLNKLNLSKKLLEITLKLIKQSNINTHFPIALMYYSELLFQMGDYENAKINAIEAKSESLRSNNNHIAVISEILIQKIYIEKIHKDKSLTNSERILLFNKSLDSLKNLLKYKNNNELTALLYFELWKLENLMKTFKIDLHITSFYRSKALSIYTILYTKRPENNFLQKIKILKN